MKKVDRLRLTLYKALDSNKKEEIFKISKELDKLIVKEMKILYVNKKAGKLNKIS